MPQEAASISDPVLVGAARRLCRLDASIAGVLWTVILGSCLAFGAVHDWAHPPLWGSALILCALLAWRTRERAVLLSLGTPIVGLALSKRVLLLGDQARAPQCRWRVDLARPALPGAPLLLPGLAFSGWVLLQLVPIPPALLALLQASPARTATGWSPLSFSVADSLRGLAFLLSALAVHAGSGVVFSGRKQAAGFARQLSLFGAALALFGLAQSAAGVREIYGFFAPLEGDGSTIFGPFVNRNHFAGYMLMTVPLAFGQLLRAQRRYASGLDGRASLARKLVALDNPEGAALLRAFLPLLAMLAALVATTSRGAILSLLTGLGVAWFAGRRGSGAKSMLVACAVLALITFGNALDRFGERMALMGSESLGRIVVWEDTLARLGGLWLAGSGYNTFAIAMSSAAPWELPRGATPWPDELREQKSGRPPLGYRAPAEAPQLVWYREAHNDYLQLLVETGIPGLGLALWGAVAVLRRTASEPTRMAALAAVLTHELVDFDLQIPALSLVFAALAGAEGSVSATGSGSPS